MVGESPDRHLRPLHLLDHEVAAEFLEETAGHDIDDIRSEAGLEHEGGLGVAHRLPDVLSLGQEPVSFTQWRLSSRVAAETKAAAAP